MIEGKYAFGPLEILAQIVRGRAELLLFVIFAHVRLDLAGGLHVFLYGAVEVIVLAERAVKERHRLYHDDREAHAKKGHERDEHPRKAAAHYKRHDEAEYEHQRRAHDEADYQHVSHLHVGHVGGHTGD